MESISIALQNAAAAAVQPGSSAVGAVFSIPHTSGAQLVVQSGAQVFDPSDEPGCGCADALLRPPATTFDPDSTGLPPPPPDSPDDEPPPPPFDPEDEFKPPPDVALPCAPEIEFPRVIPIPPILSTQLQAPDKSCEQN